MEFLEIPKNKSSNKPPRPFSTRGRNSHGASHADLYNAAAMPHGLRKAHQANDRTVMAAYGFDTKISEAECVAKLMGMYQELTGMKN